MSPSPQSRANGCCAILNATWYHEVRPVQPRRRTRPSHGRKTHDIRAASEDALPGDVRLPLRSPLFSGKEWLAQGKNANVIRS